MDWDLFNEECKVDQYMLEKNSQEQANLRVKYLSKYPGLVEQREILKKEIQQMEKELKALEGRVSLNIRENPSLWNINKVTEAAVEAVITTHPERMTAITDIHKKHLDVISIQKNIDELEVIKACLDDRKESISILSKLYINAYYADNPLDSLNEKCERMKK